MIDLIKSILEATDRMWSIKGKGYIVPNEDDIEKTLDIAAAQLYDRPVGTRLSVGGLIIERLPQGFDVYVHVGKYK